MSCMCTHTTHTHTHTHTHTRTHTRTHTYTQDTGYTVHCSPSPTVGTVHAHFSFTFFITLCALCVAITCYCHSTSTSADLLQFPLPHCCIVQCIVCCFLQEKKLMNIMAILKVEENSLSLLLALNTVMICCHKLAHAHLHACMVYSRHVCLYTNIEGEVTHFSAKIPI